MRSFLIGVALLSFLTACGKLDDSVEPGSPAAGAHAHAIGYQGAITSLGTVQIGERGFVVAQYGDCESGKEAAFVMTSLSPGDLPAITLWIENSNGKQISAGAHGHGAGDDLQFKTRPRGQPARIAIQGEGQASTAHLELRSDAAPTRDGIAAPLVDSTGKPAGWVELKLHDDKGDLELWLSIDGKMTTPLDLPIDSTLSILFQSHEKKLIQLKARNAQDNEDEDGTPNNRDGRTNYFIFPGDTGTDASWLMGHDFRGIVSVAFRRDGKPFQTDLFLLTPHSHGAAGHQH